MKQANNYKDKIYYSPAKVCHFNCIRIVALFFVDVQLASFLLPFALGTQNSPCFPLSSCRTRSRCKSSTPSQGYDASIYSLKFTYFSLEGKLGKTLLGSHLVEVITVVTSVIASFVKYTMQKFIELQKSYGYDGNYNLDHDLLDAYLSRAKYRFMSMIFAIGSTMNLYMENYFFALQCFRKFGYNDASGHGFFCAFG